MLFARFQNKKCPNDVTFRHVTIIETITHISRTATVK